MKLAKEKVLPIVMNALSEDIGSGDITSKTVFEKDLVVSADIIAKEDCVVAGLDVIRWIFEFVDERMFFKPLCADGSKIKKKKRICYMKGSIISILTAERSALNFLSRLSGVATITEKYVKKIKGSKASILDTRKTLPGFRILDKYAVKLGGGVNHRIGLWDQILIKDNHLSGTRDKGQGASIERAINKAKVKGYKNIEVEVTNLKEFDVALESGADIVMLDNMKVEDIRKAVRLRDKRQGPRNKKKTLLEVSGGVNLDTVSRIAKTGVDRISVGAITHSAPSIDFSLEIQ